MKLSVRQRVYNILKYSPEARRYPKKMMLTYMEKSGVHLDDSQVRAFLEMDDLWTVRREMQAIYESGEIERPKEYEEYTYQRYLEERYKRSKLTQEQELNRLGYSFAD